MSRGQMEGGDCGGHLVDVFERCIPRQRYQAAVGHGADFREAGLSLLSWPSDGSLPTPLPEGAVGLLHAVGVPTGLCSAELT